MAHRSVRPPDPDVDPFWHDAHRHRPPLVERARSLVGPLRSWAVAAVGILAVAGAGWWFLRPGAPPIETTLPAAQGPAAVGGSEGGTVTTTAAGATTSTTAAGLVVQAAGAVAKPGVYDLPAGARVDDLVEAAGGLTKKADSDRVNLAAPLTDGERVWLPADGEKSVPDVVAGTGGGGAPAATAGATGTGGGETAAAAAPVDLNAATAEELDGLPGVGPATATAILSYRDEHGPFGSVEELLDVRGIGEAKLDQLRPLVRV